MAALVSYPTSKTVQQLGCFALAHLAGDSSGGPPSATSFDNQKRIGMVPGSVEVLLTAIVNHPTVKYLQHLGCMALFVLSQYGPNAARLRAIPDVIATFKDARKRGLDSEFATKVLAIIEPLKPVARIASSSKKRKRTPRKREPRNRKLFQ